MRRQHHGPVKETGNVDVGDEGTGADRKRPALVAIETRADAAVLHQRRQRPVTLRRIDQFDGIDDLDVSGAAAEMTVERLGDFAAGQDAILIGQILDP